MEPIGMLVVTDADWGRMIRKIEQEVPEDPMSCWLWMGSMWKNGYGNMTMKVDGKWKPRGVHRIAYTFFRGDIPEGLDLDHLCRNRRCCNPYHLDPVTREENLRRSPLTQVGRTHCSRCGLLLSVRANGYKVCKPCCAQDKRENRARVRLSK